MEKTSWLIRISLFITLSIGGYFQVWGTVYQVGPGKTYTKLQDVANMLKPGDAVEVDGSATYPANIVLSQNGTSSQWITISGKKTSTGSRPKIIGSGTIGFNITADYVIIQGFDVSGCPKGVGVFGNKIIIRDCIIHDNNHGLIGYGTGTGSVTVEYCEFYGNAIPTGGAVQHQIYMATDEIAHPDAIFRLQYCYLHDAVQGDNVKSRAQRNEIYFNWIESAGSVGHGLGLFAPDPSDNSAVDINTAREDAEVVGNVIIQNRNACARIGGDFAGYPTNGRYRFINNTFVQSGTRGDIIRTFNTIETLEMYNNVCYNSQSGADFRIINDGDGTWLHAPRTLIGSNNWVMTGAHLVPSTTEWANTITGNVSPFIQSSLKDFRPALGSTLLNNGAPATPTIPAYPYPNPLSLPLMQPPLARLLDTGTAEKRPADGNIDIGAFEQVGLSALKQPYRNLPSITEAIDEHRNFSWYSLDGKRANPKRSRWIRLLLVNNMK